MEDGSPPAPSPILTPRGGVPFPPSSSGNRSRSWERSAPSPAAGRFDLRVPGLLPSDLPPAAAADPDPFLALLEEIGGREGAAADSLASPLRFTALLPDHNLGPARAGTGERFTPSTGRVYALLDSSDGRPRGRDRLAVKWFQPGGRQAWFSVVGILPDQPWNWFWYEDPSWEPGEWRVEAYTLDDPPLLAAAGAYRVEEEREFWGNAVVVSDPAVPWTLDDLSRGEPAWLRFAYHLGHDASATVSAVKVETGERAFHARIALPAAGSESLTPLMDPASPFPPGTYRVEVRDEEGALRARTGFVLN